MLVGAAASETAPESPAAVERWRELLQRSPCPYHRLLPGPEKTSADSLYVKFDTLEEGPLPCRRCPDYAPAGGIWQMQLDRGVFRIIRTALADLPIIG